MSRKEKPVPVRIVHDAPAPASRYREPDSMHMSVREIDNGYVINEYGWKDGKHYDRSVFSPHKPSLTAPQARGATRYEPVKKPPAPSVPKRNSGGAPQTGRAVSSKGETTAKGFMAVDFTKQPKKASPKSPLNVPSDAGLPSPKRQASRAQRLRFAKL